MAWRRIALVLLALVGVVAVGALNRVNLGPLPINQREPPDLGALLLADRDLPAGFRLAPERSGPSNDPFPAPSWMPPALLRSARMDRVPGYLRVWSEPRPGRVVVAGDYWFRLEFVAGELFDDRVRSLAASARSEFEIPAVPHARGFIEDVSGGGTNHWATFRQGSVFFMMLLVSPGGPSNEDVRLIQQLVEKQASRAPPGRTPPVGFVQLAVRFAVGALAALLIYVGLVSVAAWARDPLHRSFLSRAPPFRTPPAPGHAGVVDVTSQARRRRRRARLGLVLQLLGVVVAVTSLPPLLGYLEYRDLYQSELRLGLGLVVVGIAIAWLARGVAATPRQGRAVAPLLMGRHRPAVAAYTITAAACAFIGLGLMYIASVGTIIAVPSQFRLVGLADSFLFLAVGTLLHRRARRLAALAARDVLRRDPRPMVLYLRAFDDDRLTIRSAAFARRSLLERLTPQRFDRFEEMLARGLTAVGPVVAVNPSGTKLAPLGAARETLAGEDWQPTVKRWMRQARLVVLCVAPTQPEQGLAWELRTIDAQQLWHTTLLVFPPLPDDAVGARWREFAPLLEDTAMAGHALPADPAGTLGLVGSPSTGWTAVTAARRDEWAYTAALAAATERTQPAPEAAPAPATPPVPSPASSAPDVRWRFNPPSVPATPDEQPTEHQVPD
jgi:hypothetical protein